MSKKVKVKLKCAFGKNLPNQTVDMDEEQAERFVGRGDAEYVTEDTTSKQEQALQSKIKGLEDDAIKLNATIETQKETIKTLEESDVAGLNATIETQKETIKTLEDGDAAKLKKELTVLKGKNTKLENELTSLKDK